MVAEEFQVRNWYAGRDVVYLSKEMGDTPETIIAWVTILEASGSSFTEFNVGWFEEFGDNKGGKNGGEWATLADALFH